MHGCDLFKTSTSLRTIKSNLKFRKWAEGAFSCSLLLHDTGESVCSSLSRAKTRKSPCFIEACGNGGNRFVVVLIFEKLFLCGGHLVDFINLGC